MGFGLGGVFWVGRVVWACVGHVVSSGKWDCDGRFVGEGEVLQGWVVVWASGVVQVWMGECEYGSGWDGI